MNNLLFAVLIIVLLYYFCYYLPQQKKFSPVPKPLTSEIGVQTNPDPEITQWQTKNSELEKELTKTKKQVKDFLRVVGYSSYVELENGIKAMKQELKELKQPKPIASKQTQTDDKEAKELESTIDNLLQSIQDLNKQL